ncbi:FAD/NAD(P)-binding protein, partial [Klebsiella aerogenes]|uniref:FAD/NAD(P)-binding protein n=1 Tax=Klebsiella aerogenes TaxID=548 RepID=UPI0019542189
IEIPPIFITYLDWLKQQNAAHLARYSVYKDKLHDRQFLPRILLGEYFHDRFLAVVAEAKKAGFHIEVHPNAEVTDIKADADGVV